MKTFDSLIDTLAPLYKVVARTAELSIPDIANEFLTDSNYYAPMDTGDLKRSGITHSKFEDGLIIWKTPYARRLFYNPQYNFSKDSNPNARGLWAEYAKEVNGDKYKSLINNNFENVKRDVYS